jgi:hypothetical protein
VITRIHIFRQIIKPWLIKSVCGVKVKVDQLKKCESWPIVVYDDTQNEHIRSRFWEATDPRCPFLFGPDKMTAYPIIRLEARH